MLIIGFFVIMPILWGLFFWNQRLQQSVLNRAVSWIAIFILFVLNIKVQTSSELRKELKTNALIVSNHLSYIDILALSSQAPMCFVTSVEMKETAFLGWIVRLAGCLFVNRKNKRNLSSEVQEITDALISGHHVVIFPEAKSTNGSHLLKFRSPLFNAALDAKIDIKNIAINYEQIDGQPVSAANRDIVCWYDDMSFTKHIFKLCDSRSISVTISEGVRFSASSSSSSKELAKKSFEEISKIYKPLI